MEDIIQECFSEWGCTFPDLNDPLRAHKNKCEGLTPQCITVKPQSITEKEQIPGASEKKKNHIWKLGSKNDETSQQHHWKQKTVDKYLWISERKWFSIQNSVSCKTVNQMWQYVISDIQFPPKYNFFWLLSQGAIGQNASPKRHVI